MSDDPSDRMPGHSTEAGYPSVGTLVALLWCGLGNSEGWLKPGGYDQRRVDIQGLRVGG